MTSEVATFTTDLRERAAYERNAAVGVFKASHVKTADLLDAAADKLQRISDWCDAYPLEIFPEPDVMAVRAARQALEAQGTSLDALSASAMRHVLTRIKKMIEGEEP